MLEFDEAVCRDLELATQREWLGTNGLGGYASSTICGVNTRRYHGLLVAATRPPVGRMVLLSKLEETLTVGGESYELSVNQYPGTIHPAGHRFLKQFRLDPFPRFIYEAGGVQVEKSVYMVEGENTTVIRYQASAACRLELRPLIAFRDYHATTHENSALDAAVHRENGRIRLAPYRDLPSLYLAYDAGEVRESGYWYRDFEYARERERGLDFREDLFNPCVLTADLGAGTSWTLTASTQPRARISTPAPAPLLERAANQFIVRRGEGNSIIAGYPWFSDWGRDAMIALPGLTLTTGRPEIARGILLAFASHVDCGMLPNRFPDSGEPPEYNTADATLWFFEAVRAYLERTGELDFVHERIYGVLADIVGWHVRGTRYGIRVEEDGLLTAGDSETEITWMDARVNGRPVTPRNGKAVEIQALWYNALRVMEDLAARLAREVERNRYRELADRAAAGFNAVFWNESADCLYDVVNGGERDAAIRPNQIFAASLPHSMLAADRAARMLETVERHLRTPYGLRTLAPSDPRYRGRFEGGPASRDGAYHQGTVWPWLMGPFLRGWLATHGRSSQAAAQAREWLAPLVEYLGNQGVGQLPEVFDGDPPHRAGGCIAQAWSVAEVLRVLDEVGSGGA